MKAKTKHKILAWINALVLAGTIFWNYLSNTGIVNNATVGSVSNKYDSLFTPAGYTFAIWGIIYLGLVYNAIYTLVKAYKNEENEFILKSTPLLILANVTNSIWLWLWLNEQIALTVILLFACVLFLLIAVLKLNMERWNAPVSYMAGVWWPIDLYFGWVIVASIANMSAYLNSIGWTGGISPEVWTIIMICVATALNLFLVLTRNLREVAFVCIWALTGIAARHWNDMQNIRWTALVCASILLIVNLIHAFKNRATLPLVGKESLK